MKAFHMMENREDALAEISDREAMAHGTSG
jgi:hypothetical protein